MLGLPEDEALGEDQLFEKVPVLEVAELLEKAVQLVPQLRVLLELVVEGPAAGPVFVEGERLAGAEQPLLPLVRVDQSAAEEGDRAGEVELHDVLEVLLGFKESVMAVLVEVGPAKLDCLTVDVQLDEVLAGSAEGHLEERVSLGSAPDAQQVLDRAVEEGPDGGGDWPALAGDAEEAVQDLGAEQAGPGEQLPTVDMLRDKRKKSSKSSNF